VFERDIRAGQGDVRPAGPRLHVKRRKRRLAQRSGGTVDNRTMDALALPGMYGQAIATWTPASPNQTEELGKGRGDKKHIKRKNRGVEKGNVNRPREGAQKPCGGLCWR